MKMMSRPYWFVLAILIAPLALAAEQSGLERINAWQTVQKYEQKRDDFVTRYSRWMHEPGNENKTRAEATQALGVEDPDATPALQAALKVAQANPTDDLGFMAISFCLYGSRDGKPQIGRTEALQMLDQHYVNDPRLSRLILGLARSGGKEEIALLDKVVKQSSQRSLRAEAAYWSASERMDQVDDLRLPAAQRQAVRDDVTRLAKLVATEYGDVRMRGGSGAEAIKPVLYALENLAIGSHLPDASGQRIGGGTEKLSDYRGKVVLLDFWATWCVPCVKSLPKVVKLKEELEGRPFEVITLSIDKLQETAQDFIGKRMEMPFVNWHIGDHSELYRRWNIQGVPTYILVNQKGIVHGRSHEVESLYEVALQLAGKQKSLR